MKALSAPPRGPGAWGGPVSVDEPSMAGAAAVILLLFPIQSLMSSYCWHFALNAV